MAKRSRKLSIPFPAGGLDTRLGYSTQPPYTSPSCENVIVTSGFEKREAGGVRGGFIKSSLSTAAGAIYMLGNVNVVEDNGSSTYLETFSTSSLNSTDWSPLTGTSGLPAVYRNKWAYQPYVDSEVRGAALKAIATSTSYSHQARLFVMPTNGKFRGKYKLYVRMDTGSPAPATDGITVTLEVANASALKFTVLQKVGGATIATPSPVNLSTYLKTGWLTVDVDPTTRNVRIYWNAEQISGLNFSHSSSLDAKTRVGFALENTDSAERKNVYADRFEYNYYPSDSPPLRKSRSILVSSGGGSLYAETYHGTMSDVTPAGVTIGTSGPIDTVQNNGKLYIADWQDAAAMKRTDCRYNPAASSLSGFDEIDITGLVDQVQSSFGTTNKNWGVYVQSAGTSSASNLTVGHYTPTTFVNATSGTLGGPAGYDRIVFGKTISTGVTGTYVGTIVVHRATKEYNPVEGTVSLLDDLGTASSFAPTNCRLIANYFSRLYLAGDSFNPHVWYASRSGDFFDFDYGQPDDDFGRATLGTTQSFDNVPVSGLPITAMIPSQNDYMLFGFSEALGMLRGDPLMGGSMSFLTRSIGVVTRGAWCRTPSGTYFLSRDGMYRTSGLSIEAVSKYKVPQELLDVQPGVDVVAMVYDAHARGVWISILGRSGKAYSRWFFYEPTQAFFPLTFSTSNVAITYACEHYHGDSNQPMAVFGCSDAYIRNFHNLAERDDDDWIYGYTICGPFQIGNGDSEAMALRIVADLSLESGKVKWTAVTAPSAEECVELARSNGLGISPTSANVRRGDWTSGSNFPFNPRLRGQWFALRIDSHSDGNYRPWTLAGAEAMIVPTGRGRMLT